ncbi:MAG TPA: enoyl-CoA hydratase/isomerase family protein [Ktedonobacteraceae bacterium]|jgi:methylglutaconyl-CoA hydratase
MAAYTHITIDHSPHKKIATITLRRPEVHNAFNAQLIQDLTSAFTTLASNEQLHAVVLAAEGQSFSAGADIQMMKEAISFSEDENRQDALRLAELLYLIYTFPCPVVARVHGAAIGGGVGLVAACDIAIASENARFGFSEVKLGLAPAVISPYVVRKIGETHARALFVTGKRFGAPHAKTIGLVHAVVPPERLDETLQDTLQELESSAPQAIRSCKTLSLTIGRMDDQNARAYTSELIARLRVSDEGQEGLSAFLEKRQPHWQLD